MSNKNKKKKNNNNIKNTVKSKGAAKPSLLSMSGYTDDGSSPWIQMIPLTFFTAVIIMIVRMHSYKRNLSQFFWYNNSVNELTDFFSYFKSIAILICACLAILIIVYRLIRKSWKFENPYLYIPIGIIMLMTLISYAFSDYKEFSLLGFNDRFEGTLVWLAYMVVLIYAINIIKGERNIKWIIYPVAAVSMLLGFLGVLQVSGHDPFATPAVQKMIIPNTLVPNYSGLTYHQLIDYATQQGKQLFSFQIQDGQIYQTIYNPNNVSFYLTLLLPLFAMLFIHSVQRGKEEKIYKKIIWLGCFALALFNFVGSKSSSGLLGLGISGLLAIILLNKRLLKWWKPVAGILAVTVIIAVAAAGIWLPELTGSFTSDSTSSNTQTALEHRANDAHTLNNFVTKDNTIRVYMDNTSFTIKVLEDDPTNITVTDNKGKKITPVYAAETSEYSFEDKRLNDCYLAVVPDAENDIYDYIFTANNKETSWRFRMTSGTIKFVNNAGNEVNLTVIPSIGFENSQTFGSGRGFIWSRSLPLMKSTILAGHGADTFCMYFPQNDYVGKYNAGFCDDNYDTVIDKPHNLYINMAINTGLVSVSAFLALLLIYIIQTIRLYRKREYNSFADYVGIGIFFGVIGFAATGLLLDSSVSVMPMFFGLLGTGFAVNQHLIIYVHSYF